MRTLSYTFLCLLFSLAGADFSRAEEPVVAPVAASPSEEIGPNKTAKPGCERLYSRISYKQNFLLAGRYFPTAIKKAKARVLELENIKVKDIFPDVADAPDGFATTIKVPNTNKARRAKFQTTFNELMEERVKAGLFPRQELAAWRSWLKETQQKNAYPSLMDKDILEFIEGDGTLAEFIDLQFLRYVRASKGDPVRNVGDYLSSYYPDVVSRLKSYASRNAKRWRNWGAILGAPVLAYGGLGAANEIVTAFIAPFIDPFKKIGKDKAKETSDALVNIGTKGLAILKAPDKYQEKIIELLALQGGFTADDFTSKAVPSRAKAKEMFDAYQLAYMKILPEFHEVLLALDKSFDEKWTTDLKEKFSKIPGYRTNYDLKRSTVDQLAALIESRTDAPAKPEEMDRLSFWAGKLAESEDEISDALVTWLLYRTSVGADKVDPVMEKEYQRLYGDYVKMMDMDKLRKKLAATLDPVVSKLEAWSDKNKAASVDEKPLPTPGKIPEVAPVIVPILKEIPQAPSDVNSGPSP